MNDGTPTGEPPPTDPAGLSGLIWRELEGEREYAACVELQKETWGESFAEVVPPTLLRLAGKTGGLLAGALDPAGDLLGFVFGLAGWKGGEPFHWSHMLAVRPEARGRGIGLRLKLLQREILLARGVRTACWSYDPLVARNAHLNLERLGAEVVEYVEDMYGRRTASPLHGDFGTDRLVVRWHLEGERTARALEGGRAGAAAAGAAAAMVDPPPVVRGEPDGGPAGFEPRPGSGAVAIEVPADIEALIREDPERAAAWRRAVRRAFREYLGRGYRVEGFRRDARGGAYLLEAAGDAAAGAGGVSR